MNRRKIIVVAASSDIGAHLTERFLRGGAEVVGTYRTWSPRVAELESFGAKLFLLEITDGEQVRFFAEQLRQHEFAWNVLISAPGLLEPIGKFFSIDFDDWETSVITNSTAQLRVLHALYGLRDPSTPTKVLFFAGGGTNGPFDNYSAYCVGKLLLIKMTELLDSEYSDLSVSIVGTGWVKTKIHEQTVAADCVAGTNLEKTLAFLRGDVVGTSMESVSECVEWCLSSPRTAVGGRNISLAHDPWKDPGLVDELIADTNRYKLRRRTSDSGK